MIIIKTKKCKKCLKIKSLDCFIKDNRLKDGRRNICKECNKNRIKSTIDKSIKLKHKVCNRCKKDKSIEDFWKSSYTKDGYNNTCIECINKTYEITCVVCGKVFNTHHKSTKMCKVCFKFYEKGENNPNYNPNLTNEYRNSSKIRNIDGYKEWRKAVYKRDNYTCQCCGDNIGGNLNAHHLDGYEWCIEKRIDIDNGITLCEKCHKEFHCLYGRKNNTYSEFQEFLNLKNKHVNTEVSDNFKRLHHRNA